MDSLQQVIVKTPVAGEDYREVKRSSVEKEPVNTVSELCLCGSCHQRRSNSAVAPHGVWSWWGWSDLNSSLLITVLFHNFPDVLCRSPAPPVQRGCVSTATQPETLIELDPWIRTGQNCFMFFFVSRVFMLYYFQSVKLKWVKADSLTKQAKCMAAGAGE